jgi:asparagine synthase (glutamine-hydrolysing)
MLVDADGGMVTRTYWSIDGFLDNNDTHNEAASVEGLDKQLNESVRYHMVADVPVSAFLSGGLDSSAVVSLMRENAPELAISTYSTIFPGMPDFDEDVYARRVAELKTTDHHANRFDEDFLDDYEKIAWHLDEPFAITSAYATYYLARAAAKHTKVVLTGDGGDELFAGYEGYKNNSYLRGGGAAGIAMQIACAILLSADRFLGGKSDRINRLLTGFSRRSGPEGVRYSEQVAQNSFYAAGQVISREFMAFCLESWRNNLVAYFYDHAATTDLLQKKLYAGFRTRLADEMLMKVDRMTMAHSLEARVPLLDHRVVEYAFQLPAYVKLAGKEGNQVTKYILKKVMEKYLPGDLIYRRKQGFNIPVRYWLEGRFTTNLVERINGGLLIEQGIIKPGGVERLLQMEKHGKHNFRNMLMLLLALETWLSVYSARAGKVSFN